jgi:hypothetical protein
VTASLFVKAADILGAGDGAGLSKNEVLKGHKEAVQNLSKPGYKPRLAWKNLFKIEAPLENSLNDQSIQGLVCIYIISDSTVT